MNGYACVNSSRAAFIAILASLLMAGCASTGKAPEDEQVAAACPKDMKLQCFKRTAMREECYCMDPGEIEDLLEQIGPKGTWDRRRDGGG